MFSGKRFPARSFFFYSGKRFPERPLKSPSKRFPKLRSQPGVESVPRGAGSLLRGYEEEAEV